MHRPSRAAVLTAVDRIALTLWVGGLWVIGYLVAPTLFAALPDRMLAGEVAGRLFSSISWVGLASGALLLAIRLLPGGGAPRGSVVVVVLMLLITLVGQFGLSPAMAELKQLAPGAIQPGHPGYASFAWLHGISSTLFLINSLLGLLLVVYPRR